MAEHDESGPRRVSHGAGGWRRPLPIVAGAITSDAQAVDEQQDVAAWLRARALVDAGDVDAARAVLAALTDPPVTALRANASFLFAGVELLRGDAKAALDILARVPAATPWALDDGYRHMIAASAHRRLRDVDAALHHARRAVAHGATCGRLLVLADAQKHKGLLDEARATLERVLSDAPEEPAALAALAGLRALQGDVDAARALFARFSAVAPDDADTARSAAFFHAVMADVPALARALRRALVLDDRATRAYLADEVELDRFRSHEELRALLRE